jgi:hypothetical protein
LTEGLAALIDGERDVTGAQMDGGLELPGGHCEHTGLALAAE